MSTCPFSKYMLNLRFGREFCLRVYRLIFGAYSRFETAIRLVYMSTGSFPKDKVRLSFGRGICLHVYMSTGPFSKYMLNLSLAVDSVYMSTGCFSEHIVNLRPP